MTQSTVLEVASRIALEATLKRERAALADRRMDWEYARRGRADAWTLDDLRRATGRQEMVVEQIEAQLQAALS